MKDKRSRRTLFLASLLACALGLSDAAQALTRVNVNSAAGGRGMDRSTNRGANVNQANLNRGSASVDRNVNRSADRTDINRNVNRDIDRDIDRNVNVDVDNHDIYHPWAAAAVLTTGVALTSAVVGSMVYTLPPSCSTVMVNGMGYQQCGSTWYQPQYSGSSVSYVVVNPLR